MTPLDPAPGVARILIQKAAWDRGFMVELGARGAWLGFASTTAPGEIWMAAGGTAGPFALSATLRHVAAELGADAGTGGPGASVVWFADDDALTRAVDRVWKLARSLPPTPLAEFIAATAALPRATEAERLVVQRIGQDKFRTALLLYWNGTCPLTGVTDPALLRASHIVPWAACADDAERLDVHNGLLLSALWDAAFDAGLVSFADSGSVLTSPRLSGAARKVLECASGTRINGLSSGQRKRLQWHRTAIFGIPPVRAALAAGGGNRMLCS